MTLDWLDVELMILLPESNFCDVQAIANAIIKSQYFLMASIAVLNAIQSNCLRIFVPSIDVYYCWHYCMKKDQEWVIQSDGLMISLMSDLLAYDTYLSYLLFLKHQMNPLKILVFYYLIMTGVIYGYVKLFLQQSFS